MQSKYINVGERAYHFLEAGNGKRLLLALHGYGNDGFLFEPFVAELKDEFTLLLLDLPHHGKSEWKHGKLSKKDLADMLVSLCEQYHVAQVSLLAYSIGGRLSLCMVEQKPELIRQCTLVASDGLTFNPFYYFVTKNSLGKFLFKRFLSDEKYLRFIKLLHEKNIIQEKKYRFLMMHLQTAAQRNKLRNIWSDFSLLIPDKKRLHKVVRKYGIKMDVFMGAKDVVIPADKAKAFKKSVADAEIHIINQGHRMFDEESVPLIAQSFLRS